MILPAARYHHKCDVDSCAQQANTVLSLTPSLSPSGNVQVHTRTQDAEMRVVVVAICTDLNDVVISTEYCVHFCFFLSLGE